MFRQMLQQHQQIRSLIERFEAFLDPEAVPADIEAMIAVRWALASTIYEHVAQEDRSVYLSLKSDGRAHVARGARESRQALIALYDRTQHHVATWPTAVALVRWRDYCRATHSLLKAFRDRLAHEEATVYVWAEGNAGIQSGIMPPHERNWISPAWLARERIHGVG